MTDEQLLELDGSAGGGQLLRTALSLSMVADRPFRMENVRGARPNPGLRPQHLAAVQAAAETCDATVSGAEIGSKEVTFQPESLGGGHVSVDVETAGSVTLLFDALLPVALALDAPLAVTARGGTDVKWSPTMASLRRVKLPLLRECGVWAAVDRRRTGFYPAGGGEATLLVAPSGPPALELTDRGSLEGVRIYSTESADLAGADVARRQAASAADRFETADLPLRERTVSSVETASPGSAICVALDYETTTAGFDALGERGKPAEEVGVEAAEAALSFHEGRIDGDDREPVAAVDAHLADQLLVFLALAGGRVAIPEVTNHVRTGLDLVAAFGFPVSLEEGPPPVLVAAGADRVH